MLRLNQVLATHPEMVLRDEHFVAKRVDWEDKVANLERLASDLDIGLDAMVFVDDSSFECDSVRSRLPMVKTLQVPPDVSEYPQLVTQIKRLFAVGGESGDDTSKTARYKVRALALDDRRRHATEEEYLASLEMTVTIRRNDRPSSARVAELTQRSNQFNVTTRRYTVSEIDELMGSDGADVYSIHVADRFGEAGLTGVVITRVEGSDGLRVEALLMSCRVLGRGVEWAFWGALAQAAISDGRRTFFADYLPTPKNGQVRDFWDRLGMTLVDEDGAGRRTYRSEASAIGRFPAPPHIEVIHAF